MTFAEINRKSPEGRLLAMAITALQMGGPEEIRSLTPDEILNGLDQAAADYENLKM